MTLPKGQNAAEGHRRPQNRVGPGKAQNYRDRRDGMEGIMEVYLSTRSISARTDSAVTLHGSRMCFTRTPSWARR